MRNYLLTLLQLLEMLLLSDKLLGFLEFVLFFEFIDFFLGEQVQLFVLNILVFRQQFHNLVFLVYTEKKVNQNFGMELVNTLVKHANISKSGITTRFYHPLDRLNL